jgi:hypothetical protein
MRKQRRPSWWWLYALGPLMAGLFVVADRAPLSPAEHEAVEIGIVLLIYGLAGLWVQVNAEALEYDDQDKDAQDVPGEASGAGRRLLVLPVIRSPADSRRVLEHPARSNGSFKQ